MHQAPTSGPIYLLSGSPAAGKTTVAQALALRYDFGVHIPIDALKDWVVSGYAWPSPDHPPEAARQARLARIAAAQTARLYAAEGFAVVVEEVMWPADLAFMQEFWHGLEVRPIFLSVSREVAQARNESRTSKSFPFQLLTPTIDALASALRPEEFQAAGWKVVDNAGTDVAATVDRLLTLDWS